MLDKFKGSLMGLAVGDAVGTTLEFHQPGSFEPITDMVGGGPFKLKAGEWTDDTSMALCLAASLVLKGYDTKDQIQRYVQWREHGYMSSNGKCFDIGDTVSCALTAFKETKNSYSGSTDKYSSGNGSLMRLTPIPMYYHKEIEEAIRLAGDSSRTTHGSILCIDSCRYFSSLILGALHGYSKEQILSPRFCEIEGLFEREPLNPFVDEIAQGSFKEKNPPEIKGSGYVVQSLEAALWAFYNTKNFKDAILMAANLGDDADTTAAICGQLAGAYYGMKGIPKKWKQTLVGFDLINMMAEDLYNERV